MTNETDKQMKQLGRLALRHEGPNWNAYYAVPDSMKDALFLGSISMGAVIDNPDRTKQFSDMMRDIVSDIVEEETGTRPVWGEEVKAPEHERAGNA